jgi:hypothetical protein
MKKLLGMAMMWAVVACLLPAIAYDYVKTTVGSVVKRCKGYVSLNLH